MKGGGITIKGTKEYYHLVTRKPMYKGQMIDLSNGEHNRLYEFWMNREERTQDGRDVFDILNEKNLLNAEEQKVLVDYVFCQSRAVRETITEFVRINSFSHLPSRFSCLYVCDTIEGIMKWKKNFEQYNRTVLQLVKLRSDKSAFTGDASLLPKVNGESFDKKIEQANRYWSGEVSEGLEETLLGGKIEVLEIIQDYRCRED